MVTNIAFYKFISFPNFASLRQDFRSKTKGLELKGSILLTPEGINGFLAGSSQAISEFQCWITTQFPEFKDLVFKASYSDFNPFKRMIVKLKREVIPLGDPTIRPEIKTGKRISAQELKEWLDQKKDFLLLDTRNTYEIEHGTFDNAIHLKLQHFRYFPQELKKLPQELRDKPMVMFCTGGIRCEKASVVAMNEGFKDVYQLDGGILKYLEECGNNHYQGKCYVFDHREKIGPEDIHKCR